MFRHVDPFKPYRPMESEYDISNVPPEVSTNAYVNVLESFLSVLPSSIQKFIRVMSVDPYFITRRDMQMPGEICDSPYTESVLLSIYECPHHLHAHLVGALSLIINTTVESCLTKLPIKLDSSEIEVVSGICSSDDLFTHRARQNIWNVLTVDKHCKPFPEDYTEFCSGDPMMEIEPTPFAFTLTKSDELHPTLRLVAPDFVQSCSQRFEELLPKVV